MTGYAILAASAVSLCIIAASPSRAADAVAEADMQRFCQGKAAAKFGRSPSDISTFPVERTESGYEVYGQIGQGDDAKTFACDYAHDGTFEEVRRTGASRKRTKVELGEMAGHCRGEAAAEFHVKPDEITMQQVERNDRGGHFVHGSFAKGGGGTQRFTCRYGEQGGFRRLVHK